MYLLVGTYNGKQKVFPYKRKYDAKADMEHYYRKAIKNLTVEDTDAKFEMSETSARVKGKSELLMSIHEIPDTFLHSLPDFIEFVVIEYTQNTKTLYAYRFEKRQRAEEFIAVNRPKHPECRYCYVKKYCRYLMIEHNGHAPEIIQCNSYREAYNTMKYNYDSHRQWDVKDISRYYAIKTCTEGGYNYSWLIVGGN